MKLHSRQGKGFPFAVRLGLDLDHLGPRTLDALLIKEHGDWKVEQVVSPPSEGDVDRLAAFLVAFAFEGHGNVPERLWDECLDALVLVDDKAEGGELTRSCWSASFQEYTHTITDDLLRQIRKPILERLGDQTREGRADSQVEFDTGLDGVGHAHVKVIGLTARLVDLCGDDGAETRTLHPDTRVGFAADCHDLGSNVFAFAIAVGPNHQQVCSTRFLR